ncbi:hypothetical protein [Streptomyces sp. H51]|uniref:hypothetical protein n=1 Tax=Streptomyces sp. H51 TaxID=3111770 RepID=UPI002D791205|nr:hypothetical protein [Streptomyces sp. H51]
MLIRTMALGTTAAAAALLAVAPQAGAAPVNGCTVSGRHVTCVDYGGINRQRGQYWSAYQYNQNGIKLNICNAWNGWTITCVNY